MGALKEYWEGLPPWGKGVVGIGAGLTLFLVGDSIWNAVKQAKQNAANLQTAKDSVSFLNQLAAQGTTPSYPDAQFESWSSDLVAALGGCSADSSAIESVISSMNNVADIYKLIAMFGSREISGCKIVFIPLTGSQTLNLPAAITAFVGSSEKATLNGILASKNINYNFP